MKTNKHHSKKTYLASFFRQANRESGASIIGALIAVGLLITVSMIAMRFVDKQIKARRQINASNAHKSIHQSIELETGLQFRALFNYLADLDPANPAWLKKYPTGLLTDVIPIGNTFELTPTNNIDFKEGYDDIKLAGGPLITPEHIQKTLLSCKDDLIPLEIGHESFFQCMQLEAIPGKVDNQSKATATLARASHAFVVFSIQNKNARDFKPLNVFEWASSNSGLLVVDWTLYWRHETKDGKGIYHFRTNNYYLLSGKSGLPFFDDP